MTVSGTPPSPTLRTPSPAKAAKLPPPLPVMGGVLPTGDEEWTMWTGGKPKAGWSGLEDPRVPALNPQQMHPGPARASDTLKIHSARRTGLANKFARTGDFEIFRKAVWKHLKRCGMDMMAYVPDPADSTKMLSVVEQHSCFTPETVKMLVQPQLSLYDVYDKRNNRHANEFLLDSLKVGLQTTIAKLIDEDTPFPIAWFQVVKKVKALSFERFDKLKKDWKECKPVNFPGQSIGLMAAHLRELLSELEPAVQYTHDLTSHLFTNLLSVHGTLEELETNYRFALHLSKTEYDKVRSKLDFVSRDDARKLLDDKELLPGQILEKAEGIYDDLVARGQWALANSIPDSKKPPEQFGANFASAFAALLQHMPGSSTPGKMNSHGRTQGKCYNCGEVGHFARNCPKPKKHDHGNHPKNNGSKGGGGGGQSKSWKTTPPSASDPATKMVNGKTFRWCGKCRRWSTTHDTDSHIRGAGKSSTEVNHLAMDLGVWHTEFVVSPVSLLFQCLSQYALFALMLVAGCVSTLCLGLLFQQTTFWQTLVCYYQVTEAALGGIQWMALWAYLHAHCWSITLPLFLWSSLLLAVSYLHWNRQPPDPHRYVPPRCRKVSPSIRTMHVHRRYPLSLRALGHYMRRAPTVAARDQRATAQPFIDHVEAHRRHVPHLASQNGFGAPWRRRKGGRGGNSWQNQRFVHIRKNQ